MKLVRQRAYVGLGANLGDPAGQIRAVLDAMRHAPEMGLVKSSSLYRSAPVDAPGQPDFINAVALVETTLAPLSLLRALLDFESRFGRLRSFQNAPRTLDLDLLLYGEAVLDLAELQVPHPRMHLRRFVLAPLVEIAPLVVIPGQGGAAQLLSGLLGQDVQQVAAP